MNKKIESKRQKFIRLAELRTEKAVMAIENLIGLSNPRNYDYNTQDIEKIIKALKDSINVVSSSFSKSKEKKKFKIRWFMAEGGGFEPPKGIAPFNDLANRRLQPLSHPSAGSLYVLSVLLHAVCSSVIQNDKNYFKFF